MEDVPQVASLTVRRAATPRFSHLGADFRAHWQSSDGPICFHTHRGHRGENQQQVTHHHHIPSNREVTLHHISTSAFHRLEGGRAHRTCSPMTPSHQKHTCAIEGAALEASHKHHIPQLHVWLETRIFPGCASWWWWWW